MNNSTFTTQTLNSGRIHAPVKGAFWICLSMLCFSLINVTVKGLSSQLSPAQIAFFQNFFGLLILSPFIITQILKQRSFQSLKTKRPFLHLMRILASAGGVLLWYKAIEVLPKVADAVALVQMGPLFSVIGAKIFLKERLSTTRFLLTCLGFIGALVVLDSTRFEVGLYCLMPLFAAACFSASSLMARQLSSTEDPEKLVLYLLFFMVPMTFVPASFDFQMLASLSSLSFMVLILLGFFAACAHFSLTKAYQVADASFLGPFGFSKLPISAFIAFVAFSQVPSYNALIGGAIIICAAYLVVKFD